MAILILGGAGYIGSHAVDLFTAEGEEVVVADNLTTGHLAAVHPDALFYEGDIRDKAFLRQVFAENVIEGVIHFAASSLVGESAKNPLKYFHNNVGGAESLLEVMEEYQVRQIVFSSTAATYGEPETIPILETAQTQPKNPYGESKLMMEKMMYWCSQAYDLRYVALRYFNVAGAKLDGTIGEDHTPETHLVPLILAAAMDQKKQLTIYGDDYETPDGSCIRDYVHVVDLASAHKLALDYLRKGGESDIFNLGSSRGYSVKEMLETARRVTGKTISAAIGPRRAGDPARLVASSAKAQEILGWQPRYTDIQTIFQSAWQWHQGHPKGYKDTNE